MKRLIKYNKTALIGIIFVTCNLFANGQGNYDSRDYNRNYNYNGYSNYKGNNYHKEYNDFDYYGDNYQDFYDGLAPYGQWLYDQQFGYVWLPNVAPDFRPYYTNGYWAMTQYGNTWVSNYAWGWATFHYGRWTFDNYYGWLWIPGSEWAPAWVSWRSNNNFYGWAPMGPGINVNININLIPMDWWVFLSPNYFYQTNFHSYCYSNWASTRNIYYQTSYLHNAYGHHQSSYYTGPRAEDYYRSTGRRVSMFDINNNTSVGPTTIRGNRINIFKPSLGNNNNSSNQPSRFERIDREISRSPQNYGDGMTHTIGRQQILNLENRNKNTSEYKNGWNEQNNLQQIQQQRIQQQEQENQQALQQQLNRQREQQINQQQIQQQRDQQMKMQRDQQMNQQRIQQQQRDQQMQMQRDQQMNQQRIQQQQRDQQMQMQRDQQMQKPQPSEQRQSQDENFRGRGRF